MSSFEEKQENRRAWEAYWAQGGTVGLPEATQGHLKLIWGAVVLAVIFAVVGTIAMVRVLPIQYQNASPRVERDFVSSAPDGQLSVVGIMRASGSTDGSIRDVGRVACGLPLSGGMGIWGSGAVGVRNYLGWTSTDHNNYAVAQFTAYALSHCNDLKGTS